MSDEWKMAEKILEFEARLDASGNLKVYPLPKGDGGGAFEVGGLNERYNKDVAHRLKRLVEAGRHEEARRLAVSTIAADTAMADTWTGVRALRFFLRDTIFNRGARGAALILQDALNRGGSHLADDGVVGPKTKAAIAKHDPRRLLELLVAAREAYERHSVGRDESSQFWRGLVNRWRKARAHALTYFDDPRIEG